MTKLRRDGSEPDADRLQGEGTRITITFDFDRNESRQQEFTDKKKTRWYAIELATMFKDRIDAREDFIPSGIITIEALATYKKPGIPAADRPAINKWYDQIITHIDDGSTGQISPRSLSHGCLSLRATYHTKTSSIDNTNTLTYYENDDRTAGRERHEPLMSLLPQQEVPMGAQIDRSQVLSVVLKDASSVLSNIAALNEELSEVQKPIVKKTQDYLETLEGYSFGSLDANQEVAAQIQMLLNRLGMRIHCPKEGCTQVAILECRPAGRTTSGSFQFRHPVNGLHTSHAGSTRLPRLRLTPAPPSLRRGKKKKIN